MNKLKRLGETACDATFLACSYHKLVPNTRSVEFLAPYPVLLVHAMP